MPLIQYKQSPFFITEVDTAQGIVEAIVNVFGVLDHGGDIVRAGAFKKTIAERGTQIKVLDNHNARSITDVIGKTLAIREIGRGELPRSLVEQHPEATGGLWTRTQYLLNTTQGRESFNRIAADAVNEYSIGYIAMQSEAIKTMSADGTPIHARLLKEIKLLEVSPVIWGMNPATTTVGVKGGATAAALQRFSAAYDALYAALLALPRAETESPSVAVGSHAAPTPAVHSLTLAAISAELHEIEALLAEA